MKMDDPLPLVIFRWTPPSLSSLITELSTVLVGGTRVKAERDDCRNPATCLVRQGTEWRETSFVVFWWWHTFI